MKPGRKPIPRAERLSRGLQVCIVEGCGRAPISKKHRRCRQHPADVERAQGDGSNVQVNTTLPVALVAAAKARAADERMSLALWTRLALTRALETPVTPQRGAGSPGGGG